MKHTIVTELEDDALRCDVRTLSGPHTHPMTKKVFTVDHGVTTLWAYFDWPKDGGGPDAKIDKKSMTFQMNVAGEDIDVTPTVRSHKGNLWQLLLEACEAHLQALDPGCTCNTPQSGCCPACGPQDDDWLNEPDCTAARLRR